MQSSVSESLRLIGSWMFVSFHFLILYLGSAQKPVCTSFAFSIENICDRMGRYGWYNHLSETADQAEFYFQGKLWRCICSAEREGNSAAFGAKANCKISIHIQKYQSNSGKHPNAEICVFSFSVLHVLNRDWRHFWEFFCSLSLIRRINCNKTTTATSNDNYQ